MQILVLNGQDVHLARHEVLQLLRNRYFIGYFLSMMFMVMALKPLSSFFEMDVMTNTLLFVQGAILYLLIYFGGVLLMDHWGLRPTTIVLWPLASIATATSLIVTGQFLDLGVVTGRDVAILYVFNITVFFLGELAFVSFLLDICLRDIRRNAPVEAQALQPLGQAGAMSFAPQALAAAIPPAPAPKKIMLFGHQFDVIDLMAIRSVEHYVEVKTKSGELRLLRGRMSEATAALPETLGLHVHRSHWVANLALKELVQRRDRWHLLLHCGLQIPVARGRREAVRDWVTDVLKERR